jgi:ABC-type lipoprotein release transport system permease subunit
MMGKYINLQHESFPEWKTDSFKFYALPTLSTRSYEIENGLIGSGHPQGPMVMLIISFMLLMLACINYMNISVATISTRLKEIGIRKVMGSAKKDIVQQFIIENMLLSTFAIALGVLISYLFFLPWLITLLGYEVPFAFSSGKTMVLFFIGLFLSIILISGIYPAIYVSGFQPVTILKGKEKFGQRSLFSRILLTIQFTLAFITIVGCLVFLDNGFYMKNRDWGYDHFRNMLVPVNSYEQYVKVKDKVASRSEIESFAGAKSHIGYQNPHSFVDHEGERFEIIHYQVGFDYVETMNLRMSEGRSFDENLQTDQETSVLINEKFARSMGWVYPINQTFYLDSVKRTVVGVVKDFHCKDFYNDILPVVLAVAPETEHRFITLRARNNKLPEIEQWMEVSWKKIAPDDPYRGKVQHEVFSNLYRNIQTETKLLGFITFITLVLACLGLYGLVSYNITRRLKEFSVRKIFGARLIQIFTLMNRDFVWILSVSFVLGAPAGFFLMDNLVHHVYVYPQDTTVFPFLLSIILMGLIVFITVGIQLHRIIHENPAQTLRNE